MAYIEIYTKKNCPYCNRAKMLLLKKSLSFKEIPIDANNDNNSQSTRLEMYKRSHRNTVPQIFINNQHIGGSDDLINLNDQGKLDCLLVDTIDK